MENMYRGYPQILSMAEMNREPKPYMLYRREDKKPQMEAHKGQGRRRDSEYFRGLYPQSMRRCQSFVEAGCDRYDYPGSPIYDDYPDREALYRMRDGILKNAKDSGFEADRDLTQVLMLMEIQRRRGK